MLVDLLHDGVFLVIHDFVVEERVDLPDHVVRTDIHSTQVKSLVQPEILIQKITQ